MAHLQGADIPVIGVLEREEGTETIFEEITSEKIPNLIKTEFANPRSQQTPSTRNMGGTKKPRTKAHHNQTVQNQ